MSLPVWTSPYLAGPWYWMWSMLSYTRFYEKGCCMVCSWWRSPSSQSKPEPTHQKEPRISRRSKPRIYMWDKHSAIHFWSFNAKLKYLNYTINSLYNTNYSVKCLYIKCYRTFCYICNQKLYLVKFIVRKKIMKFQAQGSYFTRVDI